MKWLGKNSTENEENLSRKVPSCHLILWFVKFTKRLKITERIATKISEKFFCVSLYNCIINSFNEKRCELSRVESHLNTEFCSYKRRARSLEPTRWYSFMGTYGPEQNGAASKSHFNNILRFCFREKFNLSYITHILLPPLAPGLAPSTRV